MIIMSDFITACASNSFLYWFLIKRLNGVTVLGISSVKGRFTYCF